MREIAIALACAAMLSACQVQGNCSTSPSFIDYCATASEPSCQGHIIDATHWESGPESGTFLSYGAEQTYHLHFVDAKTGKGIAGELAGPPFVQVSATQGGEWIDGADQLAVFRSDADGSGLTIRNDTCAPYFFRVVVTIIPSTSADAGTE